MAREAITVDGLRELQAALRAADAALPRQLRVALNSASEVVIDYARPRVPRRSGAAAASLKVRSSQREARIAAGGRKAPYYPWLDFGGAVGPSKGVKRPFIKAGRFVYPGVSANRDKIQQTMADALTAVARAGGLEVS